MTIQSMSSAGHRAIEVDSTQIELSTTCNFPHREADVSIFVWFCSGTPQICLVEAQCSFWILCASQSSSVSQLLYFSVKTGVVKKAHSTCVLPVPIPSDMFQMELKELIVSLLNNSAYAWLLPSSSDRINPFFFLTSVGRKRLKLHPARLNALCLSPSLEEVRDACECSGCARAPVR